MRRRGGEPVAFTRAISQAPRAPAPAPAAEAHDRPAPEEERARRRQRHAGRSAGAGAWRSTQISPFTVAPSAAAKLLLLTVPVSEPLGRMSTRVSAERLPRTVPATTIRRA